MLRKLKKHVLKNNRIGRYLIYGLGEIILVVTGILIALYLDNRNEIHKQNLRFEKVIKNVKIDLQTDINELATIIPEYDHLDSLLKLIITSDYTDEYINKITQENISTCEICMPLHAQYIPFQPKSDGYLMLKLFDDLNSEEQYNISNETLLFYNNSMQELELSQKLLTELASKNLYELESYDWYIPSLRGIYNREAITYFLQSTKYKNKIASFQIIAIGNYLSRLKQYAENGESLLQKLKI